MVYVTTSYLLTTPHLRSSALQCLLRGITRPSTPPHVVAKRAPGCNRSSCGAVLESHRALFCLGVAAVSKEAASLGHSADFKEGRQRLQHVPATAAARPQNRLENLNSEEPGSPTPSVPDPELCYTPLIAGSVPLSKWGLHGPSIDGGLPAHFHWRDSHTNTAPQAPLYLALQLRKMAELLRPCMKFSITPAPPPSEPWETARAHTRGVAFTGSLQKTSKTLRGHRLKP